MQLSKTDAFREAKAVADDATLHNSCMNLIVAAMLRQFGTSKLRAIQEALTSEDAADLIDFKLKTIPPDEGPVATHNNDQPLDQCIGRIISAMIKAKPELMESEDFKDFAAEVKKDLVGTIRPITEPRNEPGGIKFRPVLDEKGKPVVRVITEEDIDRIGQACIDVISGA